MSIFSSRVIAVAALLLATELAAAAEEVHLRAVAQVTVDPQGEVSDVALQRPALPDPVRDALHEAVRALRFEPVRVDGMPASVTTTLALSTCLAGHGDALSLAIKVTSVGPQPIEQVPMPLPRALFPARDSRLDAKLEFTVEADGSARLEGLALPWLSGKARRTVHRTFAAWLASMRFLPERVDGTPVATRMEWPLAFTVTPSMPVDATAQSTCAQARAQAPDLPQRASGGSLRMRDPG
jgi:hypothetical protein